MPQNSEGGALSSRKDFKKTPRGQYEFWSEEVRAAQKRVIGWQKQADTIVQRYLDKRRDTLVWRTREVDVPFRLNLFHSNVTTLTSMLYGNLPQVDVSRRYADANDDQSRVAAEIMERLLNNDIADNGEEINAVLRSTLQDRLLPGLGCARVRYEAEFEKVEVEATAIDSEGNEEESVELVSEERLVSEDAPIDYYFWGDVLWSWGRNWSELTWVAFRSYLTKDEASERFGEEIAENLDYQRQQPNETDETQWGDGQQVDVWSKAEIWEIWDKTERKVVFLSLGYDRVLDTRDDPLELSGFFPCPPFFLANATTQLYMPTPDYHLAQDLYTEIDALQTRIAVLTKAVKAVGVYDASSEGIKRVFNEGVDNTLIPVDNWALFGEKGGLAGQIDWVPLADIVGALDKLRELRTETIGLLQQVTGMNEVMRGGSQGQYEGVGQAQLQAKFGSIRIQALQDEFAVFSSNLMQIKAEIIARHFDPQTIAARSNIEMSFDADLAGPAIALIKNPDVARLKVDIRPESVAMVDYAQLKAERTDYLNALATFLQSSAPLIQQDPAATPFLMQLMRWGLAGFKGSSEIEGIIDKAIEAMQQKQQQGQQQDPAAQAAQMEMQKEQMKVQGEMQKIQAKSQADMQMRQMDMQADIQTAAEQHKMKMAEIEADLMSKIAETRAKMEADLYMEKAQADSNMRQT
jgi:hypothetical protein